MPHTTAHQLASFAAKLLGGPLPVGLRTWDGTRAGPEDAPTVVLRNRRALRRLLYAPGELGLARAYVTGDLDVEGDLADGFRRIWALTRSGELNRAKLGPREWADAVKLAARLGVAGLPPKPPAEEARLSGKLHSLLRDRSAIAHHYDLSNAFYQLLMDESMAYSCAYFTSGSQSLEQAQHDKLELICRKLGLRPGMRLLDVGCGWGSLLVHAAKHHGVEAVGITLSAEQLQHIRGRLAQHDLEDRVEVRRQDYRELPDGPFDAVASIEMGEHVGEVNYPAYAATLHRMVKPGGRVLLQQMSRGNVAPGGGAFIERYIAPDMTMRPVGRTIDHLETAGLEVRDVHALREHYVWTVRAWAATLEENWADVVALIGETGARVWRLYLVGGALAFEENRMGVDQILAVRPDEHGRSGLPATREW
ncbi:MULTISPECIES: cyclopropane-fatty-acyl-phospholipid synthase family protein [unclassified Amycolatopsis]|uniref:cyclopropane-fatty-acyl-phospholipid synthase family protein n=1 Tax=unclassified Amycolatopsis TaxID=2618356 RepID=UPI0028753834|nr:MULTISPECIES: cyclopropane-fatty-acyl-phospholipid synthase family protein [unclassified Amycolatopsis]MDS0140525.1 class I SAM-dependent methyltransferase [Amycolatopsis sp. 505]MDS0148625.1 class I SAM-dependent methyltransferase [Amycolatopsis sp. CM201R]